MKAASFKHPQAWEPVMARNVGLLTRQQARDTLANILETGGRASIRALTGGEFSETIKLATITALGHVAGTFDEEFTK